jgi:hypothetical protein
MDSSPVSETETSSCVCTVVNSLPIPLCHPTQIARVKRFRGVSDARYLCLETNALLWLESPYLWSWAMSSHQLRAMIS